MKKPILSLLLVLLVATITLSWLTTPRKLDSTAKVRLKIGQAEVRADVAQTPAQREQGLSGRPVLGDNEGLLFVFDQPGYYSFWMKGMKFPIDIIWVDEGHHVVEITENVSPSSFPKTYTPKTPVQYVLEVAAGWVQRHKVQTGDQTSFIFPI